MKGNVDETKNNPQKFALKSLNLASLQYLNCNILHVSLLRCFRDVSIVIYISINNFIHLLPVLSLAPIHSVISKISPSAAFTQKDNCVNSEVMINHYRKINVYITSVKPFATNLHEYIE